jgi:mono/diheme cytochrome c family protein
MSVSYRLTTAFLVISIFAIPHGYAEQTETFGMGRSVSAREIATWDIDVRPDGTGLPDGSGSVAQGEQLYQEKCLACHGTRGVGGSFDQLAGRLPGDEFPFGSDPTVVKTIGNYWPYATTVFDYINRAMPYDAPGSLKATEVYGLVAYLLHLNKILPADAVLSRENLADITMPARNRFVPDDRRGGAEVR